MTTNHEELLARLDDAAQCLSEKPHVTIEMLAARCVDAAAAIRSLTEQLEALQHDIERHVQIAADLTEQLDAECRAREVATAEARLIVHVLKEERGAGAEADYYLAQVEQRATAAESKLASVERETMTPLYAAIKETGK